MDQTRHAGKRKRIKCTFFRGSSKLKASFLAAKLLQKYVVREYISSECWSSVSEANEQLVIREISINPDLSFFYEIKRESSVIQLPRISLE